MGRKSKIISAVFSMCLIVFAVVFAMTNIISATQATARSTFTVTFNALSVNAKVSVKYYTRSNPTGVHMYVSENSNLSGSEELPLDKDHTTGTLEVSDAVFSVYDYYVIYEFAFVNFDNSKAMKVDMKRTLADDSNILVFYRVDEDNSDTLITDLASLESERALIEPAEGYNNKDTQSFTISPAESANGRTGKLYMLVRVASFASNAQFAIGHIEFTLNRITPTS